MNTLADRYCKLHQQGFVPIFVSDHFDAVQLAEACVAAGASAIEITCRRQGVTDEIRRLRKAFPDIILMVGSIMDDGPMLDFLKRRRPDMPSIAELVDLGVDGLVSMMPLSPGTIARYASTHLVIPGVESLSEAITAIESGAHFAKFFSTTGLGEHKRVALATSAATHGLPPIFVTGGVTLDKIESYVAARVALLGSGWDVLLGEYYAKAQDEPRIDRLASALARFLNEMSIARKKHNAIAIGTATADYLSTLSHYHPFDA